MATGKEIKGRIRSIKSTKKITKAMELVAASKMKRAVDATLASRAYAHYAQEILEAVSQLKHDEDRIPQLLRKPANIKKVLIVLITSNRGLCGSYNTQVIKKTIEAIKKHDQQHQLSFISIGKKGDVALKRMGMNVVASFPDLPERLSLKNISPIAEYIIEQYKKEESDKVLIAYTDFRSALSQIPHVRQLLPVSIEELERVVEAVEKTDIAGERAHTEKQSSTEASFVFEPGYELLMKMLVWKLVRMQVYQMLLESNASEQSARMIAMKNASDSAGDMIEDLTLEFNKARQAAITQEISEISSGIAAMAK